MLKVCFYTNWKYWVVTCFGQISSNVGIQGNYWPYYAKLKSRICFCEFEVKVVLKVCFYTNWKYWVVTCFGQFSSNVGIQGNYWPYYAKLKSRICFCEFEVKVVLKVCFYTNWKYWVVTCFGQFSSNVGIQGNYWPYYAKLKSRICFCEFEVKVVLKVCFYTNWKYWVVTCFGQFSSNVGIQDYWPFYAKLKSRIWFANSRSKLC